jgi:hypothetical protein
MPLHATQTHAARNIASMFGGNLNGLSDTPVAADTALAVAQTPGADASGVPLPSAQLLPQPPTANKSLLAVGAFAVFSAAIHGSIVGGVAGSSWKSVQRGALIDASLAAVGTGIGGLVIGETKIGAGFLLAGLLGTAGVVYLAVKKGRN